MKMIKKYGINSSIFIGFLMVFFTVEVKAMRISPEGRRQFHQQLKKQKHIVFFSSAWEEDLANLSKEKNWDKNGFPTQEGMKVAVKDAQYLIEEKKTTNDE